MRIFKSSKIRGKICGICGAYNWHVWSRLPCDQLHCVTKKQIARQVFSTLIFFFNSWVATVFLIAAPPVDYKLLCSNFARNIKHRDANLHFIVDQSCILPLELVLLRVFVEHQWKFHKLYYPSILMDDFNPLNSLLTRFIINSSDLLPI